MNFWLYWSLIIMNDKVFLYLIKNQLLLYIKTIGNNNAIFTGLNKIPTLFIHISLHCLSSFFSTFAKRLKYLPEKWDVFFFFLVKKKNSNARKQNKTSASFFFCKTRSKKICVLFTKSRDKDSFFREYFKIFY